MSRLSRKEWYRRVNACWPAMVPPQSPEEAVRAARRLYRFAVGPTWEGEVRIASGNRYSWIEHGVLIVNPYQGWKTNVHTLSHAFGHQIGLHGHSGDHARLEMRMVKEVIRRGWLDGRLKDQPKPEVSADEVKRMALVKKYASMLRRFEQWEAKKRRAENALKKIGRQMHLHEKHTSTAVH